MSQDYLEGTPESRVQALQDALFELWDADSDDTASRAAVLGHLKTYMKDARDSIEQRLIDDGKGKACARRLSELQDNVLTALYELALNRIYRATNPSSAERIAIIAVGGYGRATMAPGSDVDLLFLLPYKQTAWGESIVEFLLYMLWDLGLKVGHSTRTIDDCARLAKQDMTIRTAMLDARLITGDEDLYSDLRERYAHEFQRGGSRDFIEAKLRERNDRHSRAGESRYLVEPNVKDGKGGLRDLNTLFWLATYHYGVDRLGPLVERGVLTRSEVRLFDKCEEFLWAVRCHLHFLTGRAEERLSFDLQRAMAERLGYNDHPGVKDVERFMRHYFLVAKDVGDLTRVLCAALELEHVKSASVMSMVVGRFRRRKAGAVPDMPGFTIEADRLNVEDDEVFKRDPVNLLRLFHASDKYNLDFHPDAIRLARRSLKLIDSKLREDEEANRLFLDILTSRNDPELILRKMNEAGVLGRFIPDFGKIVALMQFNLYHHFTVDEHLIRSLGILAAIEQGRMKDDHPLASELIGTLENRRLLYVTMLLHDIAKGRPEDHSTAGARIARRLCPRFGFSAAETATVAWLIENHLVMSMTAQSRDLSDVRTIEDFASLVQSPERLKLLLILTEADIDAVGPGTWNDWKAALLRQLYMETETVLTGGHTRVARIRRVESVKASLREALSDWSQERFDDFAERHYPAYWLRTSTERQVADAEFFDSIDTEADALAFRTEVDDVNGVTELTILAPDHPRLLSLLAGACAAASADIVDAQIFTTTDGFAFDTIRLRREPGNDADEYARANRVADHFRRAVTGEQGMAQIIAEKDKPRGRIKAFDLAPHVTISNDLSDRFTVIEVSGIDRPGLLHALTATLARLNLDITSARVATFGERAVDVFYVTDLTGQKITNTNRQGAIRRHLLATFEPAAKAA
ncbi:[protein-PII] uridylyltransferase [Tepidamorphus sp. 3E244]|uniref:[protein-PII] uridylyltransferase n=1 Tax=Tepidamorphus sp. 3E244 TaxID=3385498 RepID=UPI0038FCC57F